MLADGWQLSIVAGDACDQQVLVLVPVLVPNLCVAAQTTSFQPWLQHAVLDEDQICETANNQLLSSGCMHRLVHEHAE